MNSKENSSTASILDAELEAAICRYWENTSASAQAVRNTNIGKAIAAKRKGEQA